MVGDQELAELRQKHYGMFVRLFWQEPSPRFLRSLLEGIEARADAVAASSPQMAEGWRGIQHYLKSNEPGEVDYEFAKLFIGPHQPELTPYESYYLAGGMFQPPLANVRGFMKEVGLEKKAEELPEPEDILGFELEIMNWLVSQQLSAETPEEEEQWLERQAEFLKKHLLVWVPTCAQDLVAAPGADFYKGVGLLLQGFLELERQLFQDRGPARIVALESAQKRYGGRKSWKGPTFDATPPGVQEPEADPSAG
ncbi:MAG: molecular chaperone TorD family protein [SAR324 cluster bacterium]|nr:molecular chaperone TorD family protein [SAR324 cluster bacterium]